MNARPAHDFATPHDAEKGRFRFDLVSSEPGDSHLFWWAFDRAADEDLSAARVDRVFADFAARHAKDARFETGDALVDGWLGYVAPQSAAYEVDGLGAFRASPTYWVWGWDAMVHAGALALCGRADEVRRMLAFHRDAADPAHGILHAYNTSFGVGQAIGGATLAPSVQLFWVILLNDYVNATGDAAFKAVCRPFAVRGLSVRGATLDVEMTGSGTNAVCALNGVPLPRAFLPWTALRPGRNALRIRLMP